MNEIDDLKEFSDVLGDGRGYAPSAPINKPWDGDRGKIVMQIAEVVAPRLNLVSCQLSSLANIGDS